ncbi:MAG TPA: NAD-dependent epimerase/dehydratase family protein [Bryobacteraceae bacterium]|nr:NAD-dependent epimerase/dehydratase family protein [Bryobacteraceae bacterium]
MSVCMVTGAAGFLGSHLVDRLLGESHRVIGVDSFTGCYSPESKRANVSAALRDPNYALLEADAADLTVSMFPELPEYVFHLAGQPGVRQSWGRGFTDYVRRNIAATQSLLEALRSRPPRRFLLASSSSVYGASESYPTGETQPPRPISPYGVSKLAAENLCFAYSREFSFSSVVLRFFTAYGPRQRPDMGVFRFLHAASGGRPVEVFGGAETKRDYTYVDDVIDACLAAMRLDVRFEAINIGSGRPVSLAECLDVISRVTGRELIRLHRDRPPGDSTKTHADIEKARSLFGFEPKWPFPAGVKKQWEWYLALPATRAAVCEPSPATP